jgi:hypothetical protein
MYEGKLRDDNHLTEFQSHHGHLTAKISEIVFVASTNLLDQAMNPQAFEQARDLSRVLVRQE